MSQTDRQTDKATHWNTAVFDSGVTSTGKQFSGQWARFDTLPTFVKEVYKQKEICPDTKREHYQIHVVCHRQVRLSQLCEWIKHTKWKPVIGKEYIMNSIKYCSKKESAVEGTQEVIYGEKYYQLHELLLEIAKRYEPPAPATELSRSSELQRAMSFETLTSRMIREEITWANKLCNPVLKKCWEMWKFEFIAAVAEYASETGGAYIIEGPDSEEPSEEYAIE